MSQDANNPNPSLELTELEQELFDRLPRPPSLGHIRVSGVLILEWLRDSPSERRTGLELHQFLERARPGWSTYVRCATKAELVAAIHQAASAEGKILHIECHGCEEGLDDGSGQEFLTWDELNSSLQVINEACNCNLLVFVAACLGFAGVSALATGPRAPTMALVGPADSLSPREVLLAAEAFYQTLIDGNPHLQSMTDSSTQKSTVHFEPEPMALMAFEAWAQEMIIAARPEIREQKVARARNKLIGNFGLTEEQANARLHEFDRHQAYAAQTAWNYFFMMDRQPDNASRFGVDFVEIARRIAAFHNRAF